MLANKTQLADNIERSFKAWSTYVMILAGAAGSYFLAMPQGERDALMAQFPRLLPYSAAILTFVGVGVKWIQGSILTSKERVDQSAQAVEFLKQMASAGVLLPQATPEVLKAAPTPPPPAPTVVFADTQHIDLPTHEEIVMARLETTTTKGPTAQEMIKAAKVQFPNLSQKEIDLALRRYVATLDLPSN